MKTKYVWSYVLFMSLILLHSPVGKGEEEEPSTPTSQVTEKVKTKLQIIETDIFELLLPKSDEEKADDIEVLQKMLNGLKFGLIKTSEKTTQTEVPQTEDETTGTTTETTTISPDTTSASPPVNTTATNTTTQPTVALVNTTTTEASQPTKSEESTTIIIKTTDKIENKVTSQEIPKFPDIPVEKHFYESPFFFFVLFCLVMAVFTLYFLYVSRKKVVIC